MAKGQQPQQNAQESGFSSGGGTATTTQNLTPEQQRLISAAMPGFESFAAFTPRRYQGSTIAGFDPAQVQGQEMALAAAPVQQTLATNAANAANFYTSGDIWNPASNPYLQSAVDAAVRPITQQLTEQQLPALRGEAQNVGGFGGSRQGIAEGLASGRASTAIGDTASRLVQNQYDTNVRAQQAAINMTPMLQQAQLAPAVTTSGVGDVRQALAQALLGEQVGNFNLDQMLEIAPFLQSQALLGVAQGLPGGSTTSTMQNYGNTTGTAQATANVPRASPWAQALGGAASGASVGSMFGPIGTGVGALGGAVLPFLFN